MKTRELVVVCSYTEDGPEPWDLIRDLFLDFLKAEEDALKEAEPQEPPAED